MFIIADLDYKDIKNPFVKKTIILLFIIVVLLKRVP